MDQNNSGKDWERKRLLGRAMWYLKEQGMGAMFDRFFLRNKKHSTYKKYLRSVMPTEAELSEQRDKNSLYLTRFSIVIPLYRTNPDLLLELLDSIKNQTYKNFEVCLADGSNLEDNELTPMITEYRQLDPRFKLRTLTENRGISGNTNEALDMAKGDFVVFCDHDDLLTPDALYWLAKAVAENPECDVIYTDQDKVDSVSRRYSDPFFKPDMDWYYLESTNYICHLFAVRRKLIETVGVLDPAYDGSQDYDFTLRVCEAARQIVHVPHIVYRWRITGDSTASEGGQKLYAYEAGRRALEAHFARLGMYADVEMREGMYGVYHTNYNVPRDEIAQIGRKYILIDPLEEAPKGPECEKELLGILLRSGVGAVGATSEVTSNDVLSDMDIVDVGTFYDSVCVHKVNRLGLGPVMTYTVLWKKYLEEQASKADIVTKDILDGYCDWLIKQDYQVVYNPYAMDREAIQI